MLMFLEVGLGRGNEFGRLLYTGLIINSLTNSNNNEPNVKHYLNKQNNNLNWNKFESAIILPTALCVTFPVVIVL